MPKLSQVTISNLIMILESKNGTTRNITFSLASTVARDLEILLLKLVLATLANTVTLKTELE